MSPENTSKLIRDFPKLYREAHPLSASSIKYGFSVNDGWYELIYKLSSDIENAATKEGLSHESMDWPMVTQVKQKFGTLKFYCRTGEKK